jgi:hypothetical protein
MDFQLLISGGARAQFRKFFSYVGVLSTGDAQTWANAANTSWNTNLAPVQNNTVTLQQVVLTDLTSLSAPQAIGSTPRTGTVGGTVVPNGVAMVIKEKIARRYRGGHPRVYLPGAVITWLSNADLWNPTNTAVVLTSWNAFVSDILTNVPAAAATAAEVNVSYFTGFTNVTFPSGRVHAVPSRRVTPLVDVILSHSVNGKPASQRRRNEQSN